MRRIEVSLRIISGWLIAVVVVVCNSCLVDCFFFVDLDRIVFFFDRKKDRKGEELGDVVCM